MPFTATLTAISRADRAVNVEVLYEDVAAGFSERRVLNFNDAAGLTLLQVRTEVIRVGQQYKDALDTIATKLLAAVGSTIVI